MIHIHLYSLHFYIIYTYVYICIYIICIFIHIHISGLHRWLRGKKKICLPMQETQEMQVQSLGREDPLKEEMATLSSILAWRNPRTEDPGGQQPMASLRAGQEHSWKATFPTHNLETDKGRSLAIPGQTLCISWVNCGSPCQA